MPKRSTLFQRAVFYVKQHLADATTQEVTESKMLVDSATGEEREVDVVLTGHVGSYPVIVSIECNERKRRAGTPWVESMHAKHSTLPTNKLILVSQSGFSGPAEKKAKYLGHSTVTPGVPTEEALDKVIRDIKRLFIAAFDLLIDATYFELEKQGTYPGGTVLCENNYLIYRADGQPYARVGQLLDTLTQKITESIVDKPLTIGWSQYQWTMAPTPETGSIYLQAETPVRRLLRVTKVLVVGRVKIEESRINLNPGILEGVSHSYGEAEIAGQSATVFATAVGDGTAQVTVNISGTPDVILDGTVGS